MYKCVYVYTHRCIHIQDVDATGQIPSIFVCVCVCVRVCVCVCVCVFDACNTEISCTCGRVLFSSYVIVSVCVYECVYECVCVCVCVCIACVCVCMRFSVFACLCVCAYVSMRVLGRGRRFEPIFALRSLAEV